jgi:ATP-dependent helicase Lhr and Lhr-like helicase
MKSDRKISMRSADSPPSGDPSVTSVLSDPARRWLEQRFGKPTEIQELAWPRIAAGQHLLVSAPTGSGKTLAGFLVAIDRGARRLQALGRSGVSILYISPLRALAADIVENLVEPLRGLSEIDPVFAALRVGLRTGDTSAYERTKLYRKPPDILATTPESLQLMLLSKRGQKALASVELVIVDELHALVGSKRGPHLALSLELLDELVGSSTAEMDETTHLSRQRRCRGFQRVGLSATQEPLEEMAAYLGGCDRDVEIVATERFRALDLEVDLCDEPLTAVCSAQRWEAIYDRLAAAIESHKRTLVFVSTRRLAERVGAHLQKRLGEKAVASHHGSLAKDRRLDVEERLRQGRVSAVVATSSLELGLDIGDIDLVIQLGPPRSITTLVQRVGRSGHALSKTPKGVVIPLVVDDLVETAAIFRAIRNKVLDAAVFVSSPLDVLAQQIVTAATIRERDTEELFRLVRKAWPYRDLTKDEFCAVLESISSGRRALVHFDRFTRKVRATNRGRARAILNSGTIPDRGEFDVVLAEDETLVGSVDEDFAVESSVGDVFQLGNASWRVVKVQRNRILVSDAEGLPVSFPFWFGEGLGRTLEVGIEVGKIREHWEQLYERGSSGEDRVGWLARSCGISHRAAAVIDAYFEAGRSVLGCLPTHRRIVAERFFDSSGGAQLVIHSAFGARINRAWGLALRKKFCRSFGFELQAAATDDAILVSLSNLHSFPLEEVFNYLDPASVLHVLEQAVVGTPLFLTKWREALCCSLLVERNGPRGRVPVALQRMRAEDLLAEAFPESLACFETLPPGDLPIPKRHPFVRQALRDCLDVSMDSAGLKRILDDLKSGRLEAVAVDGAAPSVLAEGVLASQPFAFLDDAPLQERRSRAVPFPGIPTDRFPSGSLPLWAVEKTREECWPSVSSADELHEALCWMGYVSREEATACGWWDWLSELLGAGRLEPVPDIADCFKATGIPDDVLLRVYGRITAVGFVEAEQDSLEHALGPGASESLLRLEAQGKVVRVRVGDRFYWAERTAAIRAWSLVRDRGLKSGKAVDLDCYLGRLGEHDLASGLVCDGSPLSVRDFGRTAGVTPGTSGRWAGDADAENPESAASQGARGPRRTGVTGTAEVLGALWGMPIEAGEVEPRLLCSSVEQYSPELLDSLFASGEFVWFRAGPFVRLPAAKLPICIAPQPDAPTWFAIWQGSYISKDSRWEPRLSGAAQDLLDLLVAKGPRRLTDLEHELSLPWAWVESALLEALSAGMLSADGYWLVRWALGGRKRQRGAPRFAGRVWATVAELGDPSHSVPPERACLVAARALLRRWGVVWRGLPAVERLPLPWANLREAFFKLEALGEAVWGRFIRGLSGDQFGDPDFVATLVKADGPSLGFGPLRVTHA